MLREKQPDRRLAVCVFTAFSVILLFGVYSVLPTWTVPYIEHPKSPYLKARIASHWHGWQKLEHMIVFGDSWSSTGFDIDKDAPTVDNPMGNPGFPGQTVTNGANWIDYLTYTYNRSTILTVDLAVGGATIDSKLIKPGVPEFTLKSFRNQVEEWETHTWNWTMDSTLFIVWFGVNDITAWTPESKGTFQQEFAMYADLMDRLYVRGARNFLTMNAPPLERSPSYALTGTPQWVEIINGWNANLTALNKNFTETYEDTTMFLFDAWQLFDNVMRDPCTHKESCGFEVTTDACQAYFFGATTPDYKSPYCDYSVDKYLWINQLHVTTRMHDTIAKAVFDALEGA